MANPSFLVLLINDKGVVVSKEAPDSPLANSIFRMVFTNKSVFKSVWKLKVGNTLQTEQIFTGLAWSSKISATAKMPVAD